MLSAFASYTFCKNHAVHKIYFLVKLQKGAGGAKGLKWPKSISALDLFLGFCLFCRLHCASQKCFHLCLSCTTRSFFIYTPSLRSRVLSEKSVEWVSPAGAFGCHINSVKNKICVCVFFHTLEWSVSIASAIVYLFVLIWLHKKAALIPNLCTSTSTVSLKTSESHLRKILALLALS